MKFTESFVFLVCFVIKLTDYRPILTPTKYKSGLQLSDGVSAALFIVCVVGVFSPSDLHCRKMISRESERNFFDI